MTIYRQAINISSGSSGVSSAFLLWKKEPGGRNATVHPVGVRSSQGKRGQSERAAANEDMESSGARKMGRPAFHPPPEAKGEGKGARSRAREGSEGGRGIEVGSVGSQPCAPTASLLSCSLLSSRISLALPRSISLSPVLSSSSCNASSVHSFFEPGSDILHVQIFLFNFIVFLCFM